MLNFTFAGPSRVFLSVACSPQERLAVDTISPLVIPWAKIKNHPEARGIPSLCADFIFRAMNKSGVQYSVSSEVKTWIENRTKARKLLDSLKTNAKAPRIDEIVNGSDLCPLYTLRKYQATMARFGYVAKRFLLADDVGLGKTLMALTLTRMLFNEGKISNVLIVVPAPLIQNFRRDLTKFFPQEKSVECIGDLTPAKRKSIYQRVRKGKVRYTITNYEKFFHDVTDLRLCRFDMVICDEGHRLKSIISENPAKMATNFFACLAQWNPTYRVMMTGTPIENMITDLYTAYKFIDDGQIFGGQQFFDLNFVNWVIRKFMVTTRFGPFLRIEKKASGFKNNGYLNWLARPRFIRRTRLEVLPELPPHVNKVIELTLSHKEMVLYKKVDENFTDYNQVRHIALRRFIGCPSYYFTDENFSTFTKLDQLVCDLYKIAGKVLVFCFFIEEVAWVVENLKRRGIIATGLTGQDGSDKLRVIDAFAKSNSKCLVATDCINYGVNGLQVCTACIDYSLPHKPSVLEQRHGRVHRMGQEQATVSLTYVVQNTHDATVFESLERKEEIIENTIRKIDKRGYY